MMDSTIINIIIDLVNGCKGNDIIVDDFDRSQLQMKNCNYLLGQVIRNCLVPEDRWYISEAAIDYWNKITDEDIWKYEYADKIKITKSDVLKNIGLYKGGKSKPEYTTKRRGDIIQFNDLFHDEHMVDVSTIKKEIEKLNPITPEGVKIILDQMRIARILKEEDKRISTKSGRGTDMKYIMKLYENADIKLINRLNS